MNSLIDVCDATLRPGVLTRVDVDMEVDGVPFLQLSAGALRRFRSHSLRPREWCNLALRLTPNFVEVGPEYYYGFGWAYMTGLDQLGCLLAGLTDRISLGHRMRHEVRHFVRYGILSGGDADFLRRHGCDVEALAHRFGTAAVMREVAGLAERPRQANETENNIHSFLQVARVDVPREWLLGRWDRLGTECTSSLVELSLPIIGTNEVLDQLVRATQRVEPRARARPLMAIAWAKVAVSDGEWERYGEQFKELQDPEQKPRATELFERSVQGEVRRAARRRST